MYPGFIASVTLWPPQNDDTHIAFLTRPTAFSAFAFFRVRAMRMTLFSFQRYRKPGVLFVT
jgi:hypothetical protein